MVDCAWCTARVEVTGHTCSRLCYLNWYRMAELRRNEEGVIIIPDGDAVPLPVIQQPWYSREINEGDYI